MRMSLVCYSYVLVCHPYVTRMYSYVTRMSLVCTRMSSVCTRLLFYDEARNMSLLHKHPVIEYKIKAIEHKNKIVK